MSDREDLTQLILDEILLAASPRYTAAKTADEIIAAGWVKPTTEAECEISDHGHEFYDLCAFCGADAHEYFNRDVRETG